MQEQIDARAGLNGGGAGHDFVAAAGGEAMPLAALEMQAETGVTKSPLTQRARLEKMMEDADLLREVRRRVTQTIEPLSSIGERLGFRSQVFCAWVKEQGWPRPEGAPKAPQRSGAPRRKVSGGSSGIGALKTKLIGALDLQITLVEKRLKGTKAEVEEKNSRILGNLAKTLGTLMQMGEGGATSNQAEPPDRDEDVEQQLAERIKKWARGEQGY